MYTLKSAFIHPWTKKERSSFEIHQQSFLNSSNNFLKLPEVRGKLALTQIPKTSGLSYLMEGVRTPTILN